MAEPATNSPRIINPVAVAGVYRGMHRARIVVLSLTLFGLLALVFSGCSAQTVGYEGPLPSVAARRTLPQLWGKALPAGSVAFSTNAVTPYSFLVGPWGATVLAKEIAAGAAEDATVHRIPVFTDGDIADLHRRCTGTAPAAFVGELSDRYRIYVGGQ